MQTNKQNNICVCAETVHVLFSLSSGLWRNILAARFRDKRTSQLRWLWCWSWWEWRLFYCRPIFARFHGHARTSATINNFQHTRKCTSSLLRSSFNAFFSWNSLKMWPEMQPSCSGGYPSASLTDSREPSFHVCCVVRDWVLLYQ